MEQLSQHERHYLLELWQSGRSNDVGRIMFERLPPEYRPFWAAKILEEVTIWCRVDMLIINDVVAMARDPHKWAGAHKLFDEVRCCVLNFNRVQDLSKSQSMHLLILALTELVAKVTYNATNPPDEFDEDSGWYIAEALKQILDLLNNAKASEWMWRALLAY